MKFFLILVGTVAATAYAQNSFMPALQTLDETNFNINFRYNLTCAACIRGGYFYCDSDQPTDDKCCESLIDPGCMSAWTTLKCMSSLWRADSFNSLFNFCGSIQAEATCGNSSITLDAIGNST
jgi:hypothetical protein